MQTSKSGTSAAPTAHANDNLGSRMSKPLPDATVHEAQGQGAPAPELRFIRLNEVLTICGKSRSSLYEAIKRGHFPAPVKLGGRSSAWIKSEVLQWVQSCIDARRME